MNPLDRLLAKRGKTREDFKSKSKIGRILHRGGVANTAEVQRILELPIYRWQDDPEIEAMGKYLEQLLALPPRVDCRRRCGHSPRKKECMECQRAALACVCKGDGEMHLRPIQIAALQVIHDYGGLLGPIRVGGGKTLISYLAGPLLGEERVLLVIPAKLRAKTEREFSMLSRHWRSASRMHTLSYELLARDRGKAELLAFRPGLVIADEGHKFKSTTAACTKVMHRYLTKGNKDAGYIDMSGTLTKRSILDYNHRLNWAIPDGLQAVPRKYNEVKDWSDALDERVSNVGRLMPGALLQLCNQEEIQEIAKDHRKSTAVRVVRQAYGRRLLTAPAVCGTEEQFDGAMSLQIQNLDFTPGKNVVEAFSNLRADWCLPDGHPIDMPATLWRHARELVQGFYYRWDPLPPPEWVILRKQWAATVREILKNYHDIDSPLDVTRAVEQGRITWAIEPLEEWRAIKDTFIPNTVAYWIDDSCLSFVADWASKNRGIIWVNEVAFGERLSRETGLPYYGAKGLCDGKPIEAETRTCIASIAANNEGRNLQQYSVNLIVSTPPGGAIWEQLLGRTHRDGQEADEVSCDVIMACYEQWDVFRRARRDAEYTERTMSQCQKLNFADVTVQSEEQIAKLAECGNPLWDKTNAEFFSRDERWTDQELRVAALTPSQRAEQRRGFNKWT